MSEIKQITPVELIQETVAYYSADPVGRRAILSINEVPEKAPLCQYQTLDNRKCAVGRCMLDNDNLYMLSGSIDDAYWRDEYGDRKENAKWQTLIKPEYEDIPNDLWVQLQQFHDTNDNWDEEGLSERGMRVTERLLKEWA